MDLRLNRATVVDWASGLNVGGRRSPLDHDGVLDRDDGCILLMEVKRKGEPLSPGQCIHYTRVKALNPEKIEILIVTVSGTTRRTENGEALLFDPIAYIR